MDEKSLKMLLASQDQAFRTALEVITKQLHEKTNSLEVTVNDLTRSLEFTQKEVEDLKQQVKHQEREEHKNRETINKLTEILQVSGKQVQNLEERCNWQEDYSRRLNLQFVGIEESSGGETWEQTATRVSKLLENKLELPNIELERAHRVGRSIDHRTRPIIARFTRFRDRESVMRNVSKLRGTKIYVNEDLCPASQAIKRAQIPEMKQAKRDGKVAFFRHTKLIIKDGVRAPARVAWAAGGSTTASGGASSPGAVGGGDTSSSAPAPVGLARDSVPAVAEPSGGGGSATGGEFCSAPTGAPGRIGGDVTGVDGAISRGSFTHVDIAGVWRPGSGSRERSPATAGTPVAKGASGKGGDGLASVGVGQQRATRASSSTSKKK